MGDNDKKAPVNIIIRDCIVQNAPNTDTAVMNVYADQYGKHEYSHSETMVTPQREYSENPDEKKRANAISSLKVHIEDEKRLNDYLERLSICETAAQMADVIVTMRRKEGWPDNVEICKERFIETIKVLAPRVSKGNTVSNIRARIKEILK